MCFGRFLGRRAPGQPRGHQEAAPSAQVLCWKPKIALGLANFGLVANKSVSAEQGGAAKSQAANKEGAQGSSGQEGGARGGPREARGTLRRQTRATSIGRGAIPAMRAGTPDRARPTQAPPPDRGGSGARQDPPRPLHHLRYPGKQVQPRLQPVSYTHLTLPTTPYV